MAESVSKTDGAPSLEVRDGVATVTLCRPQQHNRLDPADTTVLAAHVAAIRADTSVRVAIFTGEGEKTFSSGYTVDAILEHLDSSFEILLDAIESLPMPTLCALNGSVYGGATDLALCCDFRIGVTGSRMFMPAARFGLHYYPGGMRRYVTRLGLTQAKKLFLTAMTIDAEEMKNIGFLTELVEPSELQASVQSYVSAILATEAGVVRSMKAHLNAIADGQFDAAQATRDYEASLASDTIRQRLALVKS